MRTRVMVIGLVVLMAGAARVEAQAPPASRGTSFFGDPCNVQQARSSTAAPTRRVEASRPPPPPTRIPSSVVREYGVETAPAVAPELIPVPPRSGPEVEESRNGVEPAAKQGTAYFDVYPVAGGLVDGNRSIEFWNLSDRALTLHVESQPYTLSRGKKLSLHLPRTFAWQIAGRAAEHTQLADTQAGMEIVIRR